MPPFAALALLAALVRGPADPATLTVRSDLVVRATVLSADSGWAGGDPKSGLVFTLVTLETREAWKGTAPSRLALLAEGGAVGPWDQTVSGAPTFVPGEEVVLFLTRPPSASTAGPQAPVRSPVPARPALAPPDGVPLYDVQGFGLGKFTVRREGGVMRAVRRRDELACAGCKPDELDSYSLTELRGRVQSAAAR